MANNLSTLEQTISEADKTKNITILGSTGTIGQNTIKLIKDTPDNFNVVALTARKNVKLLAEQALELNAQIAVIEDESLYPELKNSLAGTNIEASCGTEAVTEAAEYNTDLLISGIVGAAALPPTLASIKQGHTIALANKECLVCAGSFLTKAVEKYGANLIPVDSEHNAVFQSFDFDRQDMVEKITLTASGGPFRKFSKEEMKNVSLEQAVKHPNWTMGAKISIDSATMMNKGLEIIEAYHLFPIAKDQIDVVVHPESIIHSLVHYNDGSVIAGLSVPDMCVPIAYALAWPERMKTSTKRLDLAEIGKLTFEKPDTEKFPAIKLALQALKEGGTSPAILNAANEIAVESFINRKIGFLDIANVVEGTLAKIQGEKITSLEQVFKIDELARKTADELTKKV